MHRHGLSHGIMDALVRRSLKEDPKSKHKLNEEDEETLEAKKKSAAELAKMKRDREKRKNKPKDPKRSAAMKKAWANSRADMEKGWKTRRKLYGKSGRGSVSEQVEKLIEEGKITPESYASLKDSMMNVLYHEIARDESTSDSVYDTVLFDVAPLMQIIEKVSNSESMEIEDMDKENLEKYLSYMDEAIESEVPDEEEDPPDSNESRKDAEDLAEAVFRGAKVAAKKAGWKLSNQEVDVSGKEVYMELEFKL